jgi:predicted transcriptional regulator
MSLVPIRWKVKALLDEHDITPYRLMKETGLAQGTVYRLVRGDSSTVNAETLDRVVSSLRNLTGREIDIFDLLEYRESA